MTPHPLFVQLLLALLVAIFVILRQRKESRQHSPLQYSQQSGLQRPQPNGYATIAPRFQAYEQNPAAYSTPVEVGADRERQEMAGSR